MAELAIIISVHNRNDCRLRCCLRSLLAQNTSHTYEVFVVDYGSDDNLEAMLTELDSDIINYAHIDRTPFNRAHANNIALLNTDATLICITDGYYVFQSNFVEAVFENATINSVLTCTSRPTVIPQIYVESETIDIVEQMDEVLAMDGVGPGPMRGSTYVLVMDRAGLLRIRGYDEDLLCGEDVDILRRMLAAGSILVRLDQNTTVAYQAFKMEPEEKQQIGKAEQRHIAQSDAMAAYRRKSPERNLGREFGQV